MSTLSFGAVPKLRNAKREGRGLKGCVTTVQCCIGARGVDHWRYATEELYIKSTKTTAYFRD
jgi:hypothetical protein